MNFTQNIKLKWKSRIPVLLLMFLAALLRLRLTSANDYYLLEGDGPYYPVQVRSLIENFKLGLPDVPLTFIIESLVAKLFMVFTNYSSGKCILMGIRFTDAFLPPLAAIPIFLIWQELKPVDTKNNFPGYLMIAYAILNFTPVVLFSQCLHKNAMAVIWVFYYLLFIIRFIKYSQRRRHLYLALLMLALCALTHFGSFSILLLFSVVVFIFLLFRNKVILAEINYKKILAIVICVLLFICIVAIFDFARFKRLLFIPLTIFEAPLILFIMKGQDIRPHINVLNYVMVFLPFLIALIVWILNRRNLNSFQKTLSDIFLTFTFLMVNPFLGIEWADRLYLMAYAPLTIVYLIIFNNVKSKLLKRLSVVVLLFPVGLSITVGLFRPGFSLMTKEAFSEFKIINTKMSFTKNSLIVSSRNLRLLGSWFFRTKSAADYAIKKEDIKRFDAIYVIRQVKGRNFPGSENQRDEEIAANSVSVYRGEYFEISKLLNVDKWTEGRAGIPNLRGVIESIDLNSITILNKWTASIRVAEFSNHTIMHLNGGGTALKKGMYVEVWGKGKPFSLTVNAEEIFTNKYLTPAAKAPQIRYVPPQ